MKAINSKKEARREKKKKKITALAEIIILNDKDRFNRKSDEVRVSDKEIFHAKAPSVVHIESTEDEEPPSKKRLKIDDNLHENLIEVKGDTMENKGKIELSDNQYQKLKKDINERKRSLGHSPKLRLRDFGEKALIGNSEEVRTPIFLTDIQHLLMSVLLGSSTPSKPHRWCSVERGNKLTHKVVLVIEGISIKHLLSYGSHFVKTNEIFTEQLEIVMPQYEEGKIIEELASVPLTSSDKKELIEEYGSLEAAIESKKNPTLLVKTIFDISRTPNKQIDANLPEGDVFPRTQLLLSALQMVDEGYPLPLRGELATRYQNYIFTKDSYLDVTPHSPMFGLDCEMCRTTIGVSELTRISIVNEEGKCIYETLVRPANDIVDYLTKYSGITPNMMMNVTKTLKEVQEEVRNILPADAILVGQSLNSDLHAMKMMHPYVIDTSVIFNITGDRRRKTKLQTLAREFLNIIIQKDKEGHDSLEDSRSSLNLTKLKLSKGIEYGDAVLTGRKKANENYKLKNSEIAYNLLSHSTKKDRRSLIITLNNSNFDLKKFIKYEKSESEKNPADDYKKIDWIKADGNKTIVQKGQEVLMDYALTIMNLNISEQRLEETKREKTLSNIDKWISRIWDNCAHNSLFVVLFGGAPGAASGIAMSKIKKSAVDIATKIPITLE